MYASEKITRTGQKLIIREAEGNDAGVALAYVDQVCRETDFLTFGPGEFTLTLQEEVDYLEKCQREAHLLYLLALIDGQIVGVLTFEAATRPRVQHVGSFGLSVLQSHWGEGIASALMNALLEWAKQGKRIQKINLKVRADNQQAITLYERKGFTVEGILKKEILIRGVYYEHLSMGLVL